VSLAFTSRRATVHNLTVAGNHTFFVGSDGILVHNANCDYRKTFIEATGVVPERVHHRIPKMYDYPLEDAEEINNVKNLRGVTAQFHNELNRQWLTFRTARPNPTLKQVEDFAGLLDSMFGQYMIAP
jgi:hypothetical protein